VRSDLIETFKIMNRKYDLNRGLFFQIEEGGIRGHCKPYKTVQC